VPVEAWKYQELLSGLFGKRGSSCHLFDGNVSSSSTMNSTVGKSQKLIRENMANHLVKVTRQKEMWDKLKLERSKEWVKV
jgi:hypothetical protein